jgi:hypothetical protein
VTLILTVYGISTSVDSSPTATVPPALTGTVSISGVPVVGQTLTANTGALDGSGTISYQWRRGGTNISGANSSTYVLVAADAGSTITVTVTRSGYTSSVTSSPTATITFPPLYGSVTIDGICAPGYIIEVVTNLDGNGTISYTWNRTLNGITTTVGTNLTYYVSSSDVGSYISVTVTRSDRSGSVTSPEILVRP